MTRVKRNLAGLALIFVLLAGLALAYAQKNANPLSNEKESASKAEDKSVTSAGGPRAIDHVWVREGVLPFDANRALDGDLLVADAIARKFADDGDWNRAEYWFAIGAENGNPESMNGLAIVLRKTNCRRAIYWKRRYVGHEKSELVDDPLKTREYSLQKYIEECKE